jgi:sugar lactone lactonase YvrE
MAALRNVYRAANKLSEGAIWHAASKRLLWIDLYDPKLFIHDPVKGETQVRDMLQPRGAIVAHQLA